MKAPEEVKKIIEAPDLPVAYRAWREGEAPPLPYSVFYAGKANNFGADGKVYFSAQRYTIELYTEEKDPAVEQALEAYTGLKASDPLFGRVLDVYRGLGVAKK